MLPKWTSDFFISGQSNFQNWVPTSKTNLSQLDSSVLAVCHENSMYFLLRGRLGWWTLGAVHSKWDVVDLEGKSEL